MDDRFLCIKVITDQSIADKACNALEEAGIPVILEHLEVGDGDVRALGYRLLTPSTCVQHALKIVGLQGKGDRFQRNQISGSHAA